MSSPPFHHPPASSSNATATNSPGAEFVETLEYRRFAEFCDACRRYRYIGLCYGPPGVGKTLSARHYSRWDEVERANRWTVLEQTHTTLFYTPGVVNSPGAVRQEVAQLRKQSRELAQRPLRRDAEKELEALRERDRTFAEDFVWKEDWLNGSPSPPQPACGDVTRAWSEKIDRIGDPATLLLVDEADRLRMASLEQVRAIFDAGPVGVILIGMPGLEKRMARYPQFYSRIGFVHEFRPLTIAQLRELLERRWTPEAVTLPPSGFGAEAIAAVARMTGGNFRLLNRLLTQIERILEINALHEVTMEVVQAARESLVIGA